MSNRCDELSFNFTSVSLCKRCLGLSSFILFFLSDKSLSWVAEEIGKVLVACRCTSPGMFLCIDEYSSWSWMTLTLIAEKESIVPADCQRWLLEKEPAIYDNSECRLFTGLHAIICHDVDKYGSK